LSIVDAKLMARLIFVTGTPSNVAEGSGTWVGISVLRDAIVALGHEVTIIAPPPRAGRETTLSRIAFNLRVRKHLRSMTADVVVGFDLDGVFAAKASALHVAAIKGVRADEARYEHGMRRIALAIQSRLERRHVRRADRVIATSEYSATRIATLYGVDRSRIAIVPELIDLDAWDAALANAAREDGPARILTVAHLYPRKGTDTLLRAFAKVSTDAVLRIVGTGRESERLIRLARDLAISDRVNFLGHLPFSALVTEYRNGTLFALPTEQEGFGIVFLEAMASSLPIVATRVAAVPEVVADGLLVDPGDETALAQALEMLLGNRQLRERMGSEGRKHVVRFAAPTIARQFLVAIGVQTTDLLP
jgi:glycosyltransferase involved in cell wall biosynthesis